MAPASASDVVFILVIVTAVLLTAAAWLQVFRRPPLHELASYAETAGFIAVLSNTIAIVLPAFLVYYNCCLGQTQPLDANPIVALSALLLITSLVAGAFGPKRYRWLVVGSVLMVGA